MTPALGRANTPILHAYRALYKAGLRAVRYSAPARYVLRDRLRRAFRTGATHDFDELRMHNTLLLLQHAGRPDSMERKIVRGLLHTWYWEAENRVKMLSNQSYVNKNYTEGEKWMMESAMDQFNWTVRMLNESMGMCLR